MAEYMTTREAQIYLKLPAQTFKQWERDKVMDGVKHPEYKIGTGWHRLYTPESVEEAKKALGDADYHPKASVKASEWSPALIRQHGRVNLLANAKVAPVTLAGRNRSITISVAEDVTGNAASARIIGRVGIEQIAKHKRIASNDWFPGIEFKIEVA